MAKFCSNCGAELNEVQDICLKCGVQIRKDNNNQNNINNDPNAKSKMAAGLLAIFLGFVGVHNFYLGHTGKAIAQLLISVLSCFILSFVSAIWGIIEGIMILSGSTTTDAKGNLLRD